MQKLQKVYYKSDLKIRVVFRDWQTKPLPRFLFRYSTAAGAGNSVTVSYDGENYVNCSPCDQGVMVCLDFPHLMPGRLKVERFYPSDDERFADLSFNSAKEYLSGIELVDVNDFDFEQPEEVVEYAEKEQGEKGEKGDPGEPGPAGGGGVDYSPTTEQAVSGEYWLAMDGVTRKQVYCRTLKGSTRSYFGNSKLRDCNFGYSQLITMPCAVENLSVVNAWIGQPSYKPSSSLMKDEYQWEIAPAPDMGVMLFFRVQDGALNDSPYQITIKYTKL